MARKKASPKPMSGASTELRAVRLELSEESHRALRLEAAGRDVSLAELARTLVEEGLKRKSAGPK